MGKQCHTCIPYQNLRQLKHQEPGGRLQKEIRWTSRRHINKKGKMKNIWAKGLRAQHITSNTWTFFQKVHSEAPQSHRVRVEFSSPCSNKRQQILRYLNVLCHCSCPTDSSLTCTDMSLGLLERFKTDTQRLKASCNTCRDKPDLSVPLWLEVWEDLLARIK